MWFISLLNCSILLKVGLLVEPGDQIIVRVIVSSISSYNALRQYKSLRSTRYWTKFGSIPCMWLYLLFS